MSDKRDYYEVLGVDRGVDQAAIKRAYRKKAVKLHPDHNDAPDANEQFAELNEAYSVLSDEQKRSMYDRYGTVDGAGSGFVDFSDIFGGINADDIFSSIFGGGPSGGSPRDRSRRRAGRDMSITLGITLEEAACGCKKTLHYDRLAPCETCSGTGCDGDGGEVSCSHCHGTGYVTTVQRSIFGQVQSSSPCPSCGGEGTVIEHPCTSCGGDGRIRSRELLDVEIPAGVSNGHQLRIRGAGEAGFRGAPAGDLIVSMRVNDDGRFQRHGDDLLLDVRVSIAQAALGCEVEVDGVMPDETVRISVPAGSQYGDTVSVDGRGMPHVGSDARGFLIARIIVEIPTRLSGEAREALERYAEVMGEDVAVKKRSVGDRIRDAIDDILD